MKILGRLIDEMKITISGTPKKGFLNNVVTLIPNRDHFREKKKLTSDFNI